MRWPSRKSTKVSKVTDNSKTTEVTKDTIREKWCQDVKVFCDTTRYMSAASPPLDPIAVEALNLATSEYLTAWNAGLPQSSEACDDVLGNLIDSHASQGLSAKEVAVVACLSALSIPAATRHLESLVGPDIERYLRCLAIAGRMSPCVISEEELRATQCLLQVLRGEGDYVEEFLQQNEINSLGRSTGGVSKQAITREFANCSALLYLHSELQRLIDHKRFLSAFQLFSWIRSVLRNPHNQGIMTILAVHFPSWQWMAAWCPNIDRISKWEHGRFTPEQCYKLSRVFDLDGPDIATHRQESLKMSEPRCYAYVHVSDESTETLERLLHLLYRAHTLGTQAVNLFIHLCIDNCPNEPALSMVEDSIRTGDDSFCHILSILLLAPNSQTDLFQRMHNWTEALPILNDKIPGRVRYVMSLLGTQLCEVFNAAQVQFCSQLNIGSTGEHIGMRIYALGSAILHATAVHSVLPAEFVAQMRQFPPEDVLEAMFDQLQDRGKVPTSEDARFRSCLLSTLGGKSIPNQQARSITVAQIQEEVHFWKQASGSDRRDLAKKIGIFLATDYALYTSCLLVILKEHVIHVDEMRGIFRPENDQACIRFATYLADRRKLLQMQHECWLLLLISMIKQLKPSFLPILVDSMPILESLKVINALTSLLVAVQSHLPQSGPGLTQERLDWWRTLLLPEYCSTVQLLVGRQGDHGKLAWLYFPPSPEMIMELLEVLQRRQSMASIHRQIVSYLATDGRNVEVVCECIRAVKHISSVGKAACERIFMRNTTGGVHHWSGIALGAVLEAWRRNPDISQQDKLALEHIRTLLCIPISPQQYGTSSRSAIGRLQAEYDTLFNQARELESSRLRLRLESPERVSFLLSRLGVSNPSSGRAADNQIPDELLDAVESIDEAEFEVSFPLTGMSILQRQARGIAQGSRMLLVRLCLQGNPKFCIHFAPNDENQGRHQYWETISNGLHGPHSKICTTRQSLFSYYVSRNLHRLLGTANYSLRALHATVVALINSSPDTCLVCPVSIGTRIWKPTTCSPICSTVFKKKAPLEARLHNLLVDPLAMDLLLTCVYVAANDPSTLNLLPGCPVPKPRIAAVIDSFPLLATFQTASNLQAAIRGFDAYGKEREELLSWLCSRFRGMLLSVQRSSRVPSMPGTKQFLLLNSNHERERLFDAQRGTSGSSGAVFHATKVSRLFRIFTEGLKVMSNTSFMIHGASHGAGIYCADELSMSLPYAGAIGKSWKNSALSDLKIMMGCELATYAPSQMGYHVVADESRVLVRYIFLLPTSFRAPPRQHVEPAMHITFANLRSGLLA